MILSIMAIRPFYLSMVLWDFFKERDGTSFIKGGRNMNGAKVLLVDEEDTILDAYSFLLRKEGYSVSTACNGNKAIENLQRQQFDLVITDLATKNGNGHTVLEDIREIFPHTPVIVLAGKLSPIVKKFAFSMGAYALIEKPCSCELLISCIKRSLKRYKCC